MCALPGTINEDGSWALCVLLSGGRMDCCEEGRKGRGSEREKSKEGVRHKKKGTVQSQEYQFVFSCSIPADGKSHF